MACYCYWEIYWDVHCKIPLLPAGAGGRHCCGQHGDNPWITGQPPCGPPSNAAAPSSAGAASLHSGRRAVGPASGAGGSDASPAVSASPALHAGLRTSPHPSGRLSAQRLADAKHPFGASSRCPGSGHATAANPRAAPVGANPTTAAATNADVGSAPCHSSEYRALVQGTGVQPGPGRTWWVSGLLCKMTPGHGWSSWGGSQVGTSAAGV